MIGQSSHNANRLACSWDIVSDKRFTDDFGFRHQKNQVFGIWKRNVSRKNLKYLFLTNINFKKSQIVHEYCISRILAREFKITKSQSNLLKIVLSNMSPFQSHPNWPLHRNKFSKQSTLSSSLTKTRNFQKIPTSASLIKVHSSLGGWVGVEGAGVASCKVDGQDFSWSKIRPILHTARPTGVWSLAYRR